MARLNAGQFFGTVCGRLDVAGLVLTETVYDADQEICDHEHADPYSCFVVAGTFHESVATLASQCHRQGQLIFHPSGEVHSDRFEASGARCFNIQFGARWSEQLEALPVWDRSLFCPASSAATLFAVEALKQFRARDRYSALAIEGLAMGLIAELCRRPQAAFGGSPAWMQAALDYVHVHFREPFSLRSVALAADVHPVHLARTFRDRRGLSVGGYVRQLRVEYATNQVGGTNRSLSAIALESGFSDQSHFTTVFKKVVGMTPSEYRRSAQQLS